MPQRLGASRRRARIHKRLKGFGVPVQKSVFECDLAADDVARMEEKLRATVADEDLVRIYPMCASCSEKVVIIGDGDLMLEPESYVV